jgi:hypothetical protein
MYSHALTFFHGDDMKDHHHEVLFDVHVVWIRKLIKTVFK